MTNTKPQRKWRIRRTYTHCEKSWTRNITYASEEIALDIANQMNTCPEWKGIFHHTVEEVPQGGDLLDK